MSTLGDLGIGVCVLLETWLSKGDSTVLAEIKDFGFEVRSRRRRSDNKGGGVAIIYKTHVDIRIVRIKHKFISFEHMISTFTTKDKLFRIVNVYRPDYSQKHRVTPNMFFEEFLKLLDDILLLPGILNLTRDFNLLRTIMHLPY